MRESHFVVKPGEHMHLAQDGNFIILRDCNQELRVRVQELEGGSGQLLASVIMKSGSKLNLSKKFRAVELINKSGVEAKGSIIVGAGEFTDDQIVGEIKVVGGEINIAEGIKIADGLVSLKSGKVTLDGGNTTVDGAVSIAGGSVSIAGGSVGVSGSVNVGGGNLNVINDVQIAVGSGYNPMPVVVFTGSTYWTIPANSNRKVLTVVADIDNTDKVWCSYKPSSGIPLEPGASREIHFKSDMHFFGNKGDKLYLEEVSR